MNTSSPTVKELVLVGGGHSHVTVLKRFGMEPMPGVRLTLISRDVHAPYSGMLPGLIAGHYEFDEGHIDLGPLARFAGARFLHDEVVGLDPGARRVICRNRPPVHYDVLSINIGSAPRVRGVPGADGTVTPVKPIDGFWERWQQLRARCVDRADATVIAVVGGGAGGVELLLAVQHALVQALASRGRESRHLEFRLYTKATELLHTHNRWVRGQFRRVLTARGVKLYLDHEVVSVQPDPRPVLSFQNGDRARVDEVLWVTAAGAQSWPAESGLAVDPEGFIKVNEALQCVREPDVFAAGDIAAVVNHARPKAGVFAVRQGPPLEQNLRRHLRGQELRDFRPQTRFLSLISTGNRYAVASRSFWSVRGRWVWRWKDRIDRRFMRQFNELPEMPDAVPRVDSSLNGPEVLATISAGGLRCAGCGSKLGAGLLERVLARLEPGRVPELVVGLDQADDAAVLAVPAGKLLVQTVDYFRAFVDDPYVFGQATANHALGDVFAMGAEPRTAMAIVTVPYGVESAMEEDLFQMLSGALAVFRQTGTALVGGHTVEGSEMALGFAVQGLVERDRLRRKGGLQEGQALVTSKAVGTGAIFAAQMRRRAKGRWVEAALASMTLPDAAAAHILAACGATAMTDVTGFGLVGHLGEMLRASEVDAELDLAAVPLLAGAEEAVGAGIFSSLQPQNLQARHLIANAEEAADDPAYALLFDPQTAGGLMAGVPAAAADECVRQLRQSGYGAAAVIGRTVRREHASPSLRVLPRSPRANPTRS